MHVRRRIRRRRSTIVLPPRSIKAMQPAAECTTGMRPRKLVTNCNGGEVHWLHQKVQQRRPLHPKNIPSSDLVAAACCGTHATTRQSTARWHMLCKTAILQLLVVAPVLVAGRMHACSCGPARGLARSSRRTAGAACNLKKCCICSSVAQIAVQRFTACCRRVCRWTGGPLMAMHVISIAAALVCEGVLFYQRLHLPLRFCMQSDLRVVAERWWEGAGRHVVEGFGPALRPAPDGCIATGHRTAVHMERKPLRPFKSSITSLPQHLQRQPVLVGTEHSRTLCKNLLNGAHTLQQRMEPRRDSLEEFPYRTYPGISHLLNSA